MGGCVGRCRAETVQAETRAAVMAESRWLKGTELDASFSFLAPGAARVTSAESAAESAARAELGRETGESMIAAPSTGR